MQQQSGQGGGGAGGGEEGEKGPAVAVEAKSESTPSKPTWTGNRRRTNGFFGGQATTQSSNGGRYYSRVENAGRNGYGRVGVVEWVPRDRLSNHESTLGGAAAAAAAGGAAKGRSSSAECSEVEARGGGHASGGPAPDAGCLGAGRRGGGGGGGGGNRRRCFHGRHPSLSSSSSSSTAGYGYHSNYGDNGDYGEREFREGMQLGGGGRRGPPGGGYRGVGDVDHPAVDMRGFEDEAAAAMDQAAAERSAAEAMAVDAFWNAYNHQQQQQQANSWLLEEIEAFAWLRQEFAAANGIIDLVFAELQIAAGENGRYEELWACVQRRRMAWIPLLHLQRLVGLTEILAELHHVNWVRFSKKADATRGESESMGMGRNGYCRGVAEVRRGQGGDCGCCSCCGDCEMVREEDGEEEDDDDDDVGSDGKGSDRNEGAVGMAQCREIRRLAEGRIRKEAGKRREEEDEDEEEEEEEEEEQVVDLRRSRGHLRSDGRDGEAATAAGESSLPAEEQGKIHSKDGKGGATARLREEEKSMEENGCIRTDRRHGGRHGLNGRDRDCGAVELVEEEGSVDENNARETCSDGRREVVCNDEEGGGREKNVSDGSTRRIGERDGREVCIRSVVVGSKEEGLRGGEEELPEETGVRREETRCTMGKIVAEAGADVDVEMGSEGGGDRVRRRPDGDLDNRGEEGASMDDDCRRVGMEENAASCSEPPSENGVDPFDRQVCADTDSIPIAVSRASVMEPNEGGGRRGKGGSYEGEDDISMSEKKLGQCPECHVSSVKEMEGSSSERTNHETLCTAETTGEREGPKEKKGIGETRLDRHLLKTSKEDALPGSIAEEVSSVARKVESSSMSLLASGNIGIRPLSKVAACRVEDVHRAGMGRVEGREADAGIVRMMRGKANCCVLRAAEDRNARGKNGVAEEGDPNGKMEDDDDDDWEKAADRFTGCEDPVPQKVCHDGDGELSSGQDDLKSFEEDGHISSWNGVRKSDNGAGCEFNPVQEKGKHPGELRDDARDQDVHQCKLVTREMCSDEGNCCGEDFKGKEDKTGVVLGKGPEVFAVSVTSGAKLAGRWDWGAIGEYESVMSGAMEKHRDRREQGVDWREEGRNERQEKLGKAAEVVKTLRVDTSPSMYGGTGCVQSENAVEKRTWANVISLVNKPVTKAEIREGLLLSEGNRRSYSRGTRQGLHKASGLRNCDGESDVPCRDEALRIAAVTRKKSFECMERVDGKMMNTVEGLELHRNVLSKAESTQLVQMIKELQFAAEKGELLGKTIKEQDLAKGNSCLSLQFGCSISYALSGKARSTAIIPQDEDIEPMPPFLSDFVDRMVRWKVLPAAKRPDTCVIDIYEEGDWLQPHIEHHGFERPFCILSLVSRCSITLGRHVAVRGPGNFAGPFVLPLPVGSVLVMNGNAADIAKYCVPSVPQERISVTFHKMKPVKSASKDSLTHSLSVHLPLLKPASVTAAEDHPFSYASSVSSTAGQMTSSPSSPQSVIASFPSAPSSSGTSSPSPPCVGVPLPPPSITLSSTPEDESSWPSLQAPILAISKGGNSHSSKPAAIQQSQLLSSNGRPACGEQDPSTRTASQAGCKPGTSVGLTGALSVKKCATLSIQGGAAGGGISWGRRSGGSDSVTAASVLAGSSRSESKARSIGSDSLRADARMAPVDAEQAAQADAVGRRTAAAKRVPCGSQEGSNASGKDGRPMPEILKEGERRTRENCWNIRSPRLPISGEGDGAPASLPKPSMAQVLASAWAKASHPTLATSATTVTEEESGRCDVQTLSSARAQEANRSTPSEPSPSASGHPGLSSFSSSSSWLTPPPQTGWRGWASNGSQSGNWRASPSSCSHPREVSDISPSALTVKGEERWGPIKCRSAVEGSDSNRCIKGAPSEEEKVVVVEGGQASGKAAERGIQKWPALGTSMMSAGRKGRSK